MRLKLKVLKHLFSIYKLGKKATIPASFFKVNADFFSMTRTDEELSLVCKKSDILSTDAKLFEDDFKAIKVEGPLDFSLTGVLYSITKPLKEAEISIFAISTFDTDYILVKQDQLKKAMEVLSKDFDFTEDSLKNI